MKKFKLYGIMFMITLLCFACNDGGSDSPDNPIPNIPAPEETASINIDSNIITNGVVFDAKGGEQSISFTTNTDWTLSVATATNGSNWCSASLTNGSKGDVTVKFTAKENTDYDDRSVSVTIKAGTANKTLTITQKYADALSVTSNKFEVPQEGGNIDIEVKANIDYQLEIAESAKSWISESKSRALTTKKHSFTVAASEEYDKREGEIYIKSGDRVETVKVYQAGGAILLLSQNEYNVSDIGDTISVDIKSNVDYGVQMPDVDWIIDEASSRGLSSHTLKYIVASNETYDSRSAEIIFYDKNSSLKDTLKVVQAQKNAIILSQKEVVIKSEGETIEVKINTNIDFDVQIPSDIDWITKIDTRALLEKNLYLKVAPNDSYISRSANITLINENNQLSEVLSITQNGNNTIAKFAYSVNEKELEGWTVGMFDGEGTYIMSKSHGDDGYLMTIGNILSKESAIVFMDESKQIREIFIDNTIITFGENSSEGVDVSIIEKNKVEQIEHIVFTDVQSRSSDDHSHQVGIINLTQNLASMDKALKELNNVGFSKKEFSKFLLNKMDSMRNFIKAIGGPDIFSETFSSWLESSLNVVDLTELAGMYGSATLGGAAGACILAYANLYATYLELYDEHMEAYFGNNTVEIEDITFENNALNIDLNVLNCEPWYDIECGVVVQRNSSSTPRFSNGLTTKEVVKNGNYTFVESAQEDGTYYCRPFLITKEKASLWKGFIGDMVGPLVRYGNTKKYEVEKNSLKEALIKLYKSTNGDNWTRNDNWCSNKPVTEWYGITYSNNGYFINLNNNNLVGQINLDFPDDIIIKELVCSGNEITSIDVTACKNIESIHCSSNQLTKLDITKCKNLKYLYCSYNLLTSLNVFNLEALKVFQCFNNQLTSLNVSNCKSLSWLMCNTNPLKSLCISECPSLKELQCGGNNMISIDISGCIALKDLDMPISLQHLNASGCTSLTKIDCLNSVVSLDVSNCKSLTKITNKSKLKILNASNCTSLVELTFYSGDQLTSLDVSNCPSLKRLYISYGLLSSLNVSNCTSLETLHCNHNQLSSLEISSCKALESLSCGSNNLTSLDISNCINLSAVSCGSNNLTSLDISNCINLSEVECANNNLTSLDVSKCKMLERLECSNNQITALDLSGLIALNRLEFDNNPLKSFISSGCKKIPYLQGFGGQLMSLDISDCIGLSYVLCSNNQLTTIDASGCTSMKELNCSNNQLTSIDISDCIALKWFFCKNNQFCCEIPEWFSKITSFSYDVRYKYKEEKRMVKR